jgi:hypothetical protein
MAPYIIGWVAALIASSFVLFSMRGDRLLVGICLLYFGLLAFFRGQVGTDTFSYEMLFARILAGNAAWIAEGTFGAVGLLLCEATGSVEIGVRVLSLLFFCLLGIFCLRADRDELLLLSVYVLPVFGYQYSMNVLRVGIAMAVLLILGQALRRSVSIWRVAGLFAPVLFHYSSIVAGSYIVASALRLNTKVFIISIVCVGSVSAAFFFGLQEYVFGKMQVYETFAAPSEASGTSRLIIMATIGLGVLLGNLPGMAKVKFSAVSAGLALMFAALTKDTAAGLRLLDMLSFSMPLGALVAYASTSQRVDKYFKIALCLAGVAGTVAVGRNFVDEAGHGNSPFVPYSTWMSAP